MNARSEERTAFMCQGRRGDQLTTPSMELPSLWDPWVALQPGSFPCQGWKGVRHRGYTPCKFNMEMHYFVGLREARAAGGSGSFWIMQTNVLFVAARGRWFCRRRSCWVGSIRWFKGVRCWGVSQVPTHDLSITAKEGVRKYVAVLVQIDPRLLGPIDDTSFPHSSLLSPSTTR